MVNNIDLETLWKTIKNVQKINNKWSWTVFETIKDPVIDYFIGLILKNKRWNRGRKPNKEIIVRVFSALFENLDNGSKMFYLESHYNISKSTYYRYLRLFIEHNIFKEIHNKLLQLSTVPSLQIVDGTHIRSIDGSEGVAYGYKEKSKKAIKISLTVSTDRVIYLSGIHRGSLNDHIAFEDMVTKNPLNSPITVLADAGYNSKRFVKHCNEHGYKLVSDITIRKGKPSHHLTAYERILLKSKRATVEHVFAELKRFRGLQIKANKRIRFYKLLLDLGVLLVSIYNGLIKGGLLTRKIHLRRKC